jgi:hypothetical protein
MQVLPAVVEGMIAGLRSSLENFTGTGPTRGRSSRKTQLSSAANLRMKAMQASICAISMYSSG